MTRTARENSESGVYHVIIKGDGGMDIFHDDRDRFAFLATLDDLLIESRISLFAWCLMSNHVHLLIEDPGQQMGRFMQRLCTSYAKRFNTIAGRTGSVFQDRYFSVPIKTEEQLIRCVLYIHDNPLKGMGIHPKYYFWCSYREYIGTPERIAPDLVLSLLDGADGFKAATGDMRLKTYYVKQGSKVADDELDCAVRSVLGDMDPATIKNKPKAERTRLIKALKAAGLTFKQIQRKTGMGEKTIMRDCRS